MALNERTVIHLTLAEPQESVSKMNKGQRIIAGLCFYVVTEKSCYQRSLRDCPPLPPP